MKLNQLFLFVIALLALAGAGCKKTNDNTVFTTYSQFINLKPGKVIVYRLDSIVTKSFGTGFITATYTVKDSVGSAITDNTNRTAYRIFRFQYDPTLRRWKPTNTFSYTPTENTLEFVENNFRYVKLVNPVSEERSWMGNNFVSGPVFHQNSFFQSWRFIYKGVNLPKQVGTFNLPKTLTVVQYDSLENKAFNKFNFATYDKGYEIYADTIGLVYRDIISWEYQPSLKISDCKHTFPSAGGTTTVNINCSAPRANCDSIQRLPNQTVKCDTTLESFYYNGYGVRQTMLQHN